MKYNFLLARRYILSHKIKTIILLTSISITLYLPVTVNILVSRYEAHLMSRAKVTPLIIGPKGSRMDLTIHALYFKLKTTGRCTMKNWQDVQDSTYALPIPLYTRYTANQVPIVGTSLEYFSFRKLHLQSGALPIRLGDCVLGANAAQQLHVETGQSIMSDPENVFDIAGSYPLKMRVTGVLKPAGTPDDDVVFAGIETTWIIDGLAHGHQDVTKKTTAENLILEKTKRNVTANAALMHFTEVTDDTIDSFHFHLKFEERPITAIIAVPFDKKSETLLRGHYLSEESPVQMLIPTQVVEDLMGIVFKVKRFFDVNAILVSLSAGLFLGLVLALSLRLRQREIQTMFKLGCNRLTTAGLLFFELVIIITMSIGLSVMATLATLAVVKPF